MHKHYINFIEALSLKFGSDLRETKELTIGDDTSLYLDIHEPELYSRLNGVEVIEFVENYVKTIDNKIKLSYVDDFNNSTSLFVFIPHEEYGITGIFIPSSVSVMNHMFFYNNFSNSVKKSLTELEYCFRKEKRLKKVILFSLIFKKIINKIFK